MFLRNPSEIRNHLRKLQSANRLDLAVAFVGVDWDELLMDFRGSLRLICWLSSTNTNPRAIKAILRRPNTEVRQRHWMHCKVYIAPQKAAIVGSANLSRAALALGHVAGQDEAAVLVTAQQQVREISLWFQQLWGDADTRSVESSHLVAAEAAWKMAKSRNDAGPRLQPVKPEFIPSLPNKLHSSIRKLAASVRSTDLRSDMGEPCGYVQGLRLKDITKSERQELVRQIVSWTGHPGAYKTFLSQPLFRVREGLQVLLDEDANLESRLANIRSKAYLEGLQMPTLSLLLSWRFPENYIPYSARTIRFLSDFGLLRKGMSAASPRCYRNWLAFASELKLALQLPTTGHVDRVIERYNEQLVAL